MKKILLSLMSALSIFLISVQQCFALSGKQVVDETHDIPYWLIVLMIGAFIWMACLYYIEHHN